MNAERQSRRPISIIILIGLLVAVVFMGADIIYLSLRPLKYLGIDFPAVLEYTHFIVPVVAFTIWILLGRWRPISVAIAVYVLCSVAIGGVAKWADHQVEKVNITNWIDDPRQLESRLGFKVWETGDSHGTELLIAPVPGHSVQLISEVKRLGIFRP